MPELELEPRCSDSLPKCFFPSTAERHSSRTTKVMSVSLPQAQVWSLHYRDTLFCLVGPCQHKKPISLFFKVPSLLDNKDCRVPRSPPLQLNGLAAVVAPRPVPPVFTVVTCWQTSWSLRLQSISSQKSFCSTEPLVLTLPSRTQKAGTNYATHLGERTWELEP